MNKSEFINAVYKTGKYDTKAEAARAYDAVWGTLSGRLSKGTAKDRVIRLPELGTFKMKTRNARTRSEERRVGKECRSRLSP